MRYLFVLLAAISWAQESKPAASAADPVVLTVGSTKITKSQFEQIIATLPPQNRATMSTPTGRKQLAENIADLLTLAGEARARKLDQTFKVQLQIDQLLAQNVYQQFAEAPPDEAMMKAYYEEHKKEYDEVKARHILIRFKGAQGAPKPTDPTEEAALAKAKDLRTKILGGADFAKLAETESDDPGTAPHGGDLGSFGKGRMVAAFEQAAFAAEPGKVTEPVKSPFGYHLILVESHSVKPYEEAKSEIATKMKPEIAKKGLEDLKKKTTIVFDPGYFAAPALPKNPQ